MRNNESRTFLRFWIATYNSANFGLLGSSALSGLYHISRSLSNQKTLTDVECNNYRAIATFFTLRFLS